MKRILAMNNEYEYNYKQIIEIINVILKLINIKTVLLLLYKQTRSNRVNFKNSQWHYGLFLALCELFFF